MTPRWLPWNISFCPLPLRAHPHNIERRSPHVASTVEEQCSVETAVLGEQVYVDIPGCSRLRPSICTVCNCCPLSPTKTVLSEVDATFRIIKCCSHHFAFTDIHSTKCQDLRHLLRDSWPHSNLAYGWRTHRHATQWLPRCFPGCSDLLISSRASSTKSAKHVWKHFKILWISGFDPSIAQIFATWPRTEIGWKTRIQFRAQLILQCQRSMVT